MSSASILVPALDAKFRGEYTTLAALTTAAPTPNTGDTAVIIDATALGAGTSKQHVYYNGSVWLIFGSILVFAPNGATAYNDATRAPITNFTPTRNNSLGLTEFRSSRSVTVRTAAFGIVQHVVNPVGVRISNAVGVALPFGTITLASADAVNYNTMGATTTLIPASVAPPIADRYRIIHNIANASTFTAAANGIFYAGRAINGTPSTDGGQTNYVTAGTFVPVSSQSCRISWGQATGLGAGTMLGAALFQTLFAGFTYGGALTAGLSYEQ